jgi:hypothetical protein
MKAVIHWMINGVTGHGSPVDAHCAADWVEYMNDKYGAGSHWLEWCG